MPTNPTRRYNSLLIVVHWLTLLLIVLAYASMELDDIFAKGTPQRATMKDVHYMLGLSILWLTFLRLPLRLLSTAPAIEPKPVAWQARMGHYMHIALYGLMLLLPLLGWLILSAKGRVIPYFGFELARLLAPDKSLASLFKETHEVMASLGYFMIGLHATAALFHHYLLGDNTLTRMLPLRSPRKHRQLSS